jgi:hypothetical protein
MGKNCNVQGISRSARLTLLWGEVSMRRSLNYYPTMDVNTMRFAKTVSYIVSLLSFPVYNINSFR